MARYLLIMLWLCAAGAWAQSARPMSDDPALEKRVMQIAAELRCLVCQNETIAASHAELAVDLRAQIRGQLKEGRTEAQIKDFMVERYGDFVLYRPPVKPITWLLWGGPFVLLIGMLWALWRVLQRRRRHVEAPLSEAQQARARELLGESNG